MARAGVTYTEVAEAAVQLIGQGKNPTVEQVRIILGTGSSTTIAKHLRQWKTNQESTSTLSLNENLPPELIAAIKGLWERLLNQSKENMIVIESNHQQALSELQQECDKYQKNNQSWQKMMGEWVEEKKKLCSNQLTLEQALEFTHKENTSLKAKQDTLLQQLEDKDVRIDELHRLHKQTQENLEHFRESARQQRIVDEEKQANALQQVESALKLAEQQLLIANQDKAMLQQRLEQAIYENTALEKSTVILSDKLNIMETSFLKLQKEHGIAFLKADHVQQQYDALQKKWDEQTVTLIEQQTQNAVAVQQLASVRDEVKKMEEQHKLLAQEKWEIAQEKAQLEGQFKQMQKTICA